MEVPPPPAAAPAAAAGDPKPAAAAYNNNLSPHTPSPGAAEVLRPAPSPPPAALKADGFWVMAAPVGRCKLDSSLKATWFQPLNLRLHSVLST